MIKDFKEFIEEGLLSRRLHTSFGGEMRKEDVFKSNIDDLIEVDLGDKFPILFANIDLKIDGEDHFTFEEVQKINNSIKHTGWRVPHFRKDILDLFYKNSGIIKCVEFKKSPFHTYICGNGTRLYFSNIDYWALKNENDNSKDAVCFSFDSITKGPTTKIIKETHSLRIRLVKDKNINRN